MTLLLPFSCVLQNWHFIKLYFFAGASELIGNDNDPNNEPDNGPNNEPNNGLNNEPDNGPNNEPDNGPNNQPDNGQNY